MLVFLAQPAAGASAAVSRSLLLITISGNTYNVLPYPATSIPHPPPSPAFNAGNLCLSMAG